MDPSLSEAKNTTKTDSPDLEFRKELTVYIAETIIKIAQLSRNSDILHKTSDNAYLTTFVLLLSKIPAFAQTGEAFTNLAQKAYPTEAVRDTARFISDLNYAAIGKTSAIESKDFPGKSDPKKATLITDTVKSQLPLIFQEQFKDLESVL